MKELTSLRVSDLADLWLISTSINTPSSYFCSIQAHFNKNNCTKRPFVAVQRSRRHTTLISRSRALTRFEEGCYVGCVLRRLLGSLPRAHGCGRKRGDNNVQTSKNHPFQLWRIVGNKSARVLLKKKKKTVTGTERKECASAKLGTTSSPPSWIIHIYYRRPAADPTGGRSSSKGGAGLHSSS